MVSDSQTPAGENGQSSEPQNLPYREKTHKHFLKNIGLASLMFCCPAAPQVFRRCSARPQLPQA
jgi:hypothetical protein